MQEKIANSQHKWQKELVLLGVVISCEVLISDYLALISRSEIVQPFCAAITQTHWRDELAHSSIFKHIAEKIFKDLNVVQKEFFLETIVESSDWFCDPELEVWHEILLLADVPRALEIIADTGKLLLTDKHILARKKISKLLKHLKNLVPAHA
jgi:alpha-N-dichloroacetyl-p-aminophenylserinol N-oxygenase